MSPSVKRGLVEGVEAALDLGDTEQADELLGIVRDAKPGEVSPYLGAHAARLGSRVAASRGEAETVEQGFEAAAQGFREIEMPFDLGVALLEHGEWLTAQGRAADAEPLLAEAREIFERLGAKPWLERADTVEVTARGSGLTCPACSAENREGARFCAKCGTALALACPSCGAPYEPGDAFCSSCGTALSATAEERPRREPEPVAERRLVSVLFADLVGFTAASEQRDPEETRELLSRYFDTCRRLIELYGGTVEKFIGDAVMAVWGRRSATEDDAERAVRTALDLVAAVSALGDEAGMPDLRARAGVLTGEAAVTIGAEGEGMVAGDLVNTASRIQGEAEPGHGAGRGVDAPRDRGGDRLRGRRPARAQGQDGAAASLAGATGGLRAARGAQVDRPRGAVRRPRPRAAPDQGPLPRERR